jgi:SAM-dependent methyltransferase
MYKELRTYSSTGTAWASAFFADDSSFLDRIKIASLRFDSRWRAFRRYVPDGATVLDAGCGLGQWCTFLSLEGYRTVGVDFSDEMIEALNGRKPLLEWKCGSIQDLPLDDSSVDAIISWGVIEHDEAGPEAALRSFFRVLRPGGIAFISVPTDSVSQRYSSAANFSKPEATHFFQYFFTPDEFRGELARVGFELVEPVRPVSRHYGLAYPEVFRRLGEVSPLLQRVVGWVLRPVLLFMPSSENMILAVCRRV